MRSYGAAVEVVLLKGGDLLKGTLHHVCSLTYVTSRERRQAAEALFQGTVRYCCLHRLNKSFGSREEILRGGDEGRGGRWERAD